MQTIDFDATTLKDNSQSLYYDPENPSTKLVKSISIQGFNSSGKSNLLKAFQFMKFWVVNSFNESNQFQGVPVQPYLLSTSSPTKESYFEVEFVVEAIRYKYGFLLNKEKVEGEWLYYSEPKKREQNYFKRTGSDILLNSLWKKSQHVKIEPIVSYTKNNVLFISALAQFNVDIGNIVIAWFNKNLVALDVSEDYYINKTASLLKEQEFFIAIHHLIDKAKLGFKTFEYEVMKPYEGKFEKSFMEFIRQDVDNYKVQTKHDVYDDSNKKKEQRLFDLRKQESAGTQKYFALAGLILSTIKDRQILWVDEIDSKFHPQLFETIIKFFNSHKFNSRGAQLIFTTHNSHLLKDKFLRRDQIYTVTKNEFGESSITNAARSNARMDISYEKQFFDGKFGGTQKLNFDEGQLDLFQDGI